MAILTEKRRVCDVCNDGENIRQYRVTYLGDGRSLSADLCEEHAEPFEELRNLMPDGKRGRTRSQVVVSQGEAEAAAKAQRKKPAAKRASSSAKKKT